MLAVGVGKGRRTVCLRWREDKSLALNKGKNEKGTTRGRKLTA